MMCLERGKNIILERGGGVVFGSKCRPLVQYYKQKSNMTFKKLRISVIPTNIFCEISLPATKYPAHFDEDEQKDENHLNRFHHAE